jgi:hypothetical protein
MWRGAHSGDVEAVKTAIIVNAQAKLDGAVRTATFSDHLDRLLAHVGRVKATGAGASQARPGPVVTPTPAGAKL